MVAMSDFSTFSQITYHSRIVSKMNIHKQQIATGVGVAYRNTVGVFLSNAVGFLLALLDGVVVLKLGSHDCRLQCVEV